MQKIKKEMLKKVNGGNGSQGYQNMYEINNTLYNAQFYFSKNEASKYNKRVYE